jgi:hypothetical protein
MTQPTHRARRRRGGMRDPAGRGSSSGVRKHSEHTLGEYFYRAFMNSMQHSRVSSALRPL